MGSFQTYRSRSKHVGKFWSLYSLAFDVTKLKYCLLSVLIGMAMDFVQLNVLALMVRPQRGHGHAQLAMVFLLLVKLANARYNRDLQVLCAAENTAVSTRAVEMTNGWLLCSTHAWQHKHPDGLGRDHMRRIQEAFDNVQWGVFGAVNSMATVAVYLWWLRDMRGIWLVSLAAYLAAAFAFNRNTKKISELMVNTEVGRARMELEIGNAHALQADVMACPAFGNPGAWLPGLYSQLFGLFDLKNAEVNGLFSKFEFISACALMALVVLNPPAAISIIVLHCPKIFTFFRDFSHLHLTQTSMREHLGQVFAVLDDWEQAEAPTDDHMVHALKTSAVVDKVQFNMGVTADGKRTFSSGRLEFPMDGRFTVIVGNNGHGKSLLLTCITGGFDGGQGSSELFLDGHPVANGTLNTQWRTHFVGHVRQSMVDMYRRNKKNCLTLTLRQLFPDHPDPHALLGPLKIRALPADLDTAVADSEVALSKGQTQAIVLASAIWRLRRTRVLVLDEPEQSMNISATKAVFSSLVIGKFGHVLLVTHSKELVEWLSVHAKAVGQVVEVEDLRVKVGKDKGV